VKHIIQVSRLRTTCCWCRFSINSFCVSKVWLRLSFSAQEVIRVRFFFT